jgi:sodium-dependent dicarboxylate transporter 2/3/5
MKNSKKIQTTGLILGVLCFFLAIGFIDSPPDHPHTGKMAAVTLLMAVWWITEALPLAATALLPLALFPFLEIMDGKQSPPGSFWGSWRPLPS